MSVAPFPNTMKYRRIAATLRAEILRGELPPGSRLPTRCRLEARFAATPPTVQKAADLLVARGYVVARGRRGTFVVDRLPGRRHYALAFPWPRQRDVSQFYRGLAWQAEAMSNSHRRLECFHDISSHAGDDYRRLIELVRSHRLHGLIFCTNPFEVANSPLLTEPGLPRVAIENLPSKSTMASVYPDLDAFRRQAVETLLTAGRRRIAHLLLPGTGWQEMGDDLRRLSDEFRLPLPEAWLQGAQADVPVVARHIVQAWMREAPTSRPDALVVHDDNLAPEAARGLLATGVRIPEEVTVVVHANFPFPTPCAVPVIPIGADLRDLLQACLDRIDEQIRGETPPAMTRVPVGQLAEARQSGDRPPTGDPRP